MENASKALLIASGVLFAILVISIGVLFYNNLTAPTDSYVAKLDATELQKYNSPFEVYISRTDVTAQEIVTIVSESKQKDKNIKVSITNMGNNKYLNMQNFTTDELNDFLNENIQYFEKNEGELVYFKCVDADGDGITYGDDGRVIAIEFVKVGETVNNPIIEDTTTPEAPTIPEDNGGGGDGGDDKNKSPTFKKCSGFTDSMFGQYVIDPDGDFTYVYAQIDAIILNTSNSSDTYYWENFKEYGAKPENIPESYWKKCTYSANGSKDYADDYSSKFYWVKPDSIKIVGASENLNINKWTTIIRIKFYAKDKYHGWVNTSYTYRVNQCKDGRIDRYSLPSSWEGGRNYY